MISTNTNHNNNNNIVYANKTVSEHESGYFEDCDEQTSMDKGNSDCSSLVRSSQNENNNNNCVDKGKLFCYFLKGNIVRYFGFKKIKGSLLLI